MTVVCCRTLEICQVRREIVSWLKLPYSQGNEVWRAPTFLQIITDYSVSGIRLFVIRLARLSLSTRVFFATLAALLLPQYCFAAAFVQEPDLLQRCQHEPPSVDAYTSWCYGYLLGVVDGISANGMKVGTISICLPDDVEPSELKDTLLSYLKTHEKSGQTNAAHEVALALSNAWPCQKKH